jgi:hypothetical protein
MDVEKTVTQRGFGLYKFLDRYGNGCSLQDSSLAEESAIWLGIDDPDPKIMCSDASKLKVNRQSENGWQPFYIPEEVQINTRMHLTQDQVKALLPVLQYFAETGNYIKEFEEEN